VKKKIFLIAIAVVLAWVFAIVVFHPQPAGTPVVSFSSSMSTLNTKDMNVTQGTTVQVNLTFTETLDTQVTIPIENLKLIAYNQTVDYSNWDSRYWNTSLIQEKVFNYSFSLNRLTLQPAKSNSTIITINVAQDAPTGRYELSLYSGNIKDEISGLSFTESIPIELIVVPKSAQPQTTPSTTPAPSENPLTTPPAQPTTPTVIPSASATESTPTQTFSAAPSTSPSATPRPTLPFEQNSSLKIESVIYNTTGSGLLGRLIDSHVSDIIVTNPVSRDQIVSSLMIFCPRENPTAEQYSLTVSIIVPGNSTVDIQKFMSATSGYPGALFYIVIRTSEGYTAVSEPFTLLG
jgi:hypothetical protein